MAMLFVRGISDSNQIEIKPKRSGQYDLKLDGSCNVFSHMGFDKKVAGAMILFGNKVKQPSFKLPMVPTLIFNQISDPDSHQGALARCKTLCDQVPSPVINRPEGILRTTRDSVSEMLQGIPGVIMPPTIRFQPRSPEDVFTEASARGLGFPFILRIAGVHGGKSSMLVSGEQDLAQLHAYPFDGSWFYMTEFVDYKSSDGLYRKIRIAVVDGKPLFRHMLVDNQWMIHVSSLDYMDKNPALYTETDAVFENFETELAPKIQTMIDAINTRLRLEYFGIDCNINAAGEMLIFEANANMNIFTNTRTKFTRQIEVIKKHVKKLIHDRNISN